MKSPLHDYIENLDSFLSAVLSPEDVDECLAETEGHLEEKVDELVQRGATRIDAEQTAVLEFGAVGEIAAEFVKGFPPKNHFNMRKLRWMPEVVVLIFTAMQVFSYSLFKDMPGNEATKSMSMILIMVSPMLVIPAFFGSMARLVYRRMKPISIQTRMATYGLCFVLVGISCNIWLHFTNQLTNDQFLNSLQGVTACFTLIAYGSMRLLNSNGKAFAAIYQRFGRQ